MYKARKDQSSEIYLNNAIKDYSKAVHLSPGDHLAYLHRGRCLLQKGLYREARNDLITAFGLSNGFKNNTIYVNSFISILMQAIWSLVIFGTL
jgi:Flp pilus assembly protein TadD